MKISIAMGTFNGAPYIQEQLDSLAAQTYLPTELVVCDDCSSDDTLEIVRRFSRTAPFPVRIYKNERNLGYGDNFLKAARLCEGSWVAFCDQDDVWLRTKLETVRDCVVSRSSVVLVVHRTRMVDGELKELGATWPPEIRKTKCWAVGTLPLYFLVPGCVCAFDRRLLSIAVGALRPPEPRDLGKGCWQQTANSGWICALAAVFGSVFVTRTALALYRRHEHTATTKMYGKSSIRTLIRRSSGVGQLYYSLQADCARAWSKFYFDLSIHGEVGVDSKAAAQCARRYWRLGQALDSRATVYAPGAPVSRRVRALGALCATGAYWTRDHNVLTSKSFCKDAASVLVPQWVGLQ